MLIWVIYARSGKKIANCLQLIFSLTLKHRSRQGKILVEDFEHQLKKSESFASRMLKRLCPSVDLKTALANYNQYDPHDNILLIVTFYKKDYHNIPLLEIMYRHHFKVMFRFVYS